tara:strand:- start:439 stop:1518 length:1080 start_codon:yes stop_codon:yes gene_type:complete
MEHKYYTVLKSFNLILNDYLNGYLFPKKSLLLYPLIKAIDIRVVKNQINLISELTEINIEGDSNYSLAQFLIEINSWLHNNKINKVEEKIVDTFFRENMNFSSSKKINNFIKNLNKYFLLNYTHFFGIHGSYSSNDYAENISDIDLVVILKEECFFSVKKLMRIQNYIFSIRKRTYNFDLFQHHGLFILTENYLNNYNENFFPTNLFKLTKTIYSDRSSFKLDVIEDKSNKKEILKQTIEYLLNTDFSKLNFYEFKTYFQVIQLLPISYLQFVKNFTDKKNSFNEFYNYYPEFKELYKNIYTLRINWVQPKAIKPIAFKQHLFLKKTYYPSENLIKELKLLLNNNNFTQSLLKIKNETL